MELSAHEIISGGLTIVAGVFSYLAKHFLGSIKEKQNALLVAVGKVDGRVEALAKAVHENTVAQAKTQTETKALWRFIDGAYGRASDGDGETNGHG